MKKRYLIFLFLVILSCTSCSKWELQYPDDTEKSKVTPRDRLVNETWIHSNTTINGKDCTQAIKDVLGAYEIRFGTTPTSKYYFGNFTTTLHGTQTAKWRLELADAYITIEPIINSSVNYLMPCLMDSNYMYQILTLSDAEFKIKIITEDMDSTIINSFSRK